MAYNVAVDVGGTFTDVLVFNEQTGELTEEKVLSTPEDPSEGVISGIERVCEKVGISFTDLHLLFHGTYNNPMTAEQARETLAGLR